MCPATTPRSYRMQHSQCWAVIHMHGLPESGVTYWPWEPRGVVNLSPAHTAVLCFTVIRLPCWVLHHKCFCMLASRIWNAFRSTTVDLPNERSSYRCLSIQLKAPRTSSTRIHNASSEELGWRHCSWSITRKRHSKDIGSDRNANDLHIHVRPGRPQSVHHL